MITVTHLVKAFNGKDILKDVNVTFPKGKTTVIIGPSGSGKTTLLRCLNLLETPTEGSIAFDLDTYQFSEKTKLSTERVLNLRRKSGMVFQSFNLFPHKTVEQNIIEGPVIVKKQDKNLALAKAAELLRKVGLSDRAQHYPHQLSGGQKQRVAIARALAMEPEVILFDEPTSALDPELEMEVLRVIQDLATEHNTMIIVTHNMDFARAIADYVIFIEAGKIVEAGEKAQVFGHPKEKRTQEFLRLFSKSQFE